MATNNSIDLGDYVAVLRRRKFQLLIPTALVLCIAIGIAYGLPPVYRSTATVLIEQQDIPHELVRTTVTSYATERIQVISQRVLTRENLWNIIEEFDLYPDRRGEEDRFEVLSKMRSNIGIDMISAEVGDPTSGRTGRATIAFELGYESHDPVSARQVTSELVSLFLEENTRMRTQMASETSEFLAEEANKLSRRLAELEAELAAFKERNVGALPEMMQLNLTQMERTERELEDAQRQIASLQERKITLASQQALLDPNTGESPEGRLRALQAQYMSAATAYSPDHPDVVSLRREIEALRSQVGTTSSVRQIETQIREVQSELNASRERYSENHPDILRLQRTLATLEDELANTRAAAGDNFIESRFEADNPAYVAVQSQLDAINIQLEATMQLRDRLKERLATYEARIMRIPSVEQENAALQRDYENTVKKFHDIRQKQMEAQVAEQLEKESRGERFSLIEAPYTPSQPHKPNRLGILLLGVVLSMTSGIGFASVAEFLDRTVRGSRGVTALAGAPPLVMIPYIRNEEDQTRKNRKILLGGAMVFAALVLGLLSAQYFLAA